MTELNTTPNPHPPTLVFIPGGAFEMGDVMGDHEKDDELVHTVTLSDFHLASHLLTFAEYFVFCRAKGYQTWLRPDDHPLDKVRWYRAIEYCNWRSQSEGLQLVYRVRGRKVTFDRQANAYRLPTEAEWEYAAKGGQESRNYVYAGSNDGEEVAWTIENSRSKTQPVGLKKANEIGLYDMNGNVWEWCWDWHDQNQYYYHDQNVDPKGPSKGYRRIGRGGSWRNHLYLATILERDSSHPNIRSNAIGFRIARSVVDEIKLQLK